MAYVVQAVNRLGYPWDLVHLYLDPYPEAHESTEIESWTARGYVSLAYQRYYNETAGAPPGPRELRTSDYQWGMEPKIDGCSDLWAVRTFFRRMSRIERRCKSVSGSHRADLWLLEDDPVKAEERTPDTIGMIPEDAWMRSPLNLIGILTWSCGAFELRDRKCSDGRHRRVAA